jgi:hypothetical protein
MCGYFLVRIWVRPFLGLLDNSSSFDQRRFVQFVAILANARNHGLVLIWSHYRRVYFIAVTVQRVIGGITVWCNPCFRGAYLAAAAVSLKPELTNWQ